MDEIVEANQTTVYKDQQTQNMLNKPPADPTGVDLEDQKYLDKIIKYVNEGKIKLLVPNSLINDSIYDRLSDQEKAEIDVKKMAVLSSKFSFLK